MPMWWAPSGTPARTVRTAEGAGVPELNFIFRIVVSCQQVSLTAGDKYQPSAVVRLAYHIDRQFKCCVASFAR